MGVRAALVLRDYCLRNSGRYENPVAIVFVLMRSMMLTEAWRHESATAPAELSLRQLHQRVASYATMGQSVFVPGTVVSPDYLAEYLLVVHRHQIARGDFDGANPVASGGNVLRLKVVTQPVVVAISLR